MSIETRGFEYGEVKGKARRNAIAYSARIERLHKAKVEHIAFAVSLVTAVVVLFATAQYLAYYKVEAKVVASEDHVTTFELANGHQYDVLTDGEFNVGDTVTLTIDGKGTDNTAEDDIVVNVRN